MPSVRPKLVEEGTPISGTVGSSSGVEDVAMKTADNLYVIGSNNSNNTTPTSRSSLSMHMDNSSSRNSTAATGRRRSSAGTSKGTSSLARAAKGTFMQDKFAKKPVVQTSFVVGGSPTNFQDEKKSGDSPYGTGTSSSSMMIDDSSSRRPSRPPVTTTSYQIPDNGHTAYYYTNNMELDSPPSSNKRQSKPTAQSTAFVVGRMETDEGNYNSNNKQSSESSTDVDDEGEVEKMEGVVDLSEKPPLCVLDGANIAYAYGKIVQGGSDPQMKPEPDARGIVVTCEYFTSAGIRVLAVIPSTWTHRDPHQKILKKLEEQGVLVPAPPRDDDDAYAITIARREQAKAQQRGDGPGYVLSNDMFRDAIARSQEEGGGDDLKQWLTEGSTVDQGKTGPGRISFAFLDAGSMDDHGDKVLDILPNPRHPLIQFVEQTRHKS